MLQVVLILDSREQYNNVGKNRIESLSAHLQMVRSHYANVEVRELKVGDVVWIARSRCKLPHSLNIQNDVILIADMTCMLAVLFLDFMVHQSFDISKFCMLPVQHAVSKCNKQ